MGKFVIRNLIKKALNKHINLLTRYFEGQKFKKSYSGSALARARGYCRIVCALPLPCNTPILSFTPKISFLGGFKCHLIPVYYHMIKLI